MAAIVRGLRGGLCTENPPEREPMEKSEDISGEAYVQPSNANRRVLRTF